MPDRNTQLGTVMASRIRHFRKLRGLTQDALAERLNDLGLSGFNQSMVAKVESDPVRAENLPTRRLLAIAMALNVAPIHLLTPDDPADPMTMDGGVEVLAGSVRQWIRGGWPLRDGDDRRDYFAAIPRNEFEALIGQRANRQPGDGMAAAAFYLDEDAPR